MIDMMLKVLPQVAAEVTGPISQAKKITMVSTGDGPIGANRMTSEVLDIMNSLPETVKKMTGVDVTSTMVSAKWESRIDQVNQSINLHVALSGLHWLKVFYTLHFM